MIYIVGSTNRTGISMSTQGYLKPFELTGIKHQFVPYSDFSKELTWYKRQRCIIVPIPSAWNFSLNTPTDFTNIFVCESNTIPKKDRLLLKCMKDIWTPSTFCQKILQYYDIDSKVLPYSIEAPSRPRKKEHTRFTFMCSFDGKFTIIRKGVLNAIDSFKQAFQNKDDVCLIIKTFDLNASSKKIILAAIDNDNRIVLKNEFVVDRDALFDNIDCYVSLHASEGFGMHIAEALYREIPVIVTNYGGNTDFCNHHTSYLVGGIFEDHSYDAQYSWSGVWLKPHLCEAVEQMQDVYKNYNEALKKAKAGKNLVELKYSVASISTQIKKYENSVLSHS